MSALFCRTAVSWLQSFAVAGLMAAGLLVLARPAGAEQAEVVLRAEVPVDTGGPTGDEAAGEKPAEADVSNRVETGKGAGETDAAPRTLASGRAARFRAGFNTVCLTLEALERSRPMPEDVFVHTSGRILAAGHLPAAPCRPNWRRLLRSQRAVRGGSWVAVVGTVGAAVAWTSAIITFFRYVSGEPEGEPDGEPEVTILGASGIFAIGLYVGGSGAAMGGSIAGTRVLRRAGYPVSRLNARLTIPLWLVLGPFGLIPAIRQYRLNRAVIHQIDVESRALHRRPADIALVPMLGPHGLRGLQLGVTF